MNVGSNKDWVEHNKTNTVCGSFNVSCTYKENSWTNNSFCKFVLDEEPTIISVQVKSTSYNVGYTQIHKSHVTPLSEI